MTTRLTLAPAGAVEFEGARLRALISAETVDRAGDRLLAAGVELDAFRRNPVLLWAHDLTVPPIGRAVAVEPEPGVGVWAINEFAPTGFAQQIAELYREGFLNAFSVGFRPLEVDTRQRVAGQTGATIRRWELVEQSAVAVPANPDALVAAAAEGHRAADWLLKAWGASPRPAGFGPDDESAGAAGRAAGGGAPLGDATAPAGREAGPDELYQTLRVLRAVLRQSGASDADRGGAGRDGVLSGCRAGGVDDDGRE